ncbi:MAG: DNA circularization N-terminal domain-containing protein [Erythrobacter sp.]|uniref:DNA circularization protein n=1 Tax=Erythrobacter sp. TaxID=1042 RepID=UPI0025FAD7A7|nr:DNA circularization N-terminal domain-containing protein [Erythrobacter sp.]MCL9999233.1 DNA circularization N-terminal domain-containing protein [Erythrobacter sp.]
MAWRDQYQQGSFRGAPFRTEAEERTGGRRIVSHEFPGRDEPVTEDLGRRAKQFSIDCHVIGAEFLKQRDDLLTALEAPGPGLLVHPQYGRMMAVVFDYACSTSTEEGGIARFRITFGEAGQAVPSKFSKSAGNEAEKMADNVTGKAPKDFEKGFSIEDAASFVEEAATEIVKGMGQISQLAAGLRGGVGPALRAFEAGLNFLPANVVSLLRAPLSLAMSVTGLVLAVSALGGGGRRTRLQSLEMLVDWQPPEMEAPIRTPQRELEMANRVALTHLFHVVAAAELVRTAAALDYPSYEEAVAVRDSVSDRLDRLALAAADRGDDAAAEDFDQLRRALALDIAARGASLARVYHLRLAASEPALVLAHRLYGGDVDRRARAPLTLEARAAAIVARNAIAHPGFVPAGVEIELLTDAPGNEVRAA